jgi:hypothetical protein
MISVTLPKEVVRAEYENKVLRQNVKELQAQLQKAFIRIIELVGERDSRRPQQ